MTPHGCCVRVVGMEFIIYFFAVVVPGTAFLAAMWRYDDKHVPTGQNFMYTAEELRELWSWMK